MGFNSLVLERQFLKDKVSYEDTAQSGARIKILGLLWDRKNDEIILSAHKRYSFLYLT